MTTDLQTPRLPEGICTGASKCATTSLHYYLKAHPQVGVQPRKEMRFFTDLGTWDKGVEWYKRQFPLGKGCLVELFGRYYAAFPKEPLVPQRIHSLIPNAKLIYMVRDPIDRMISCYAHNYSELKEHRPAEEALSDFEDVEYVPQSKYYAQLERYFPYFVPEQFLVVDDNDFKNDRAAALRRIFEFLHVQPGFWSAEFDIIRHPSSQKRRLTPTGILFHRAVGQHVLKYLYGHQDHIFRKIFYTPISTAIARPKLSAGLRAQLREIFKPDVARLEEFTGRKFAGWLNEGPA